MRRPPAGLSAQALGTLAAVGAYTLWGLVPVYWPLLDPAQPLEILAHRVVWTLVFVAGLLVVTRGWPTVWEIAGSARRLGLLAVAGTLVAINWGVFIWAVTNGFVLESSLGYFINPLVSVLLGVVLLGERLTPLQLLAVVAAALGVLVIALGYGRLPLVSLALAVSFGLYGLVKKRAGVGAIPSLAVETALVAPLAAGYLVRLQVAGSGTFLGHGAVQPLLFAGGGVVTAVPLLLFGAAAIRIPLISLGILQYIGPVLQFLLGLFVFGERMTPARWGGFLLVWAALALFTADAARRLRTNA